MSTTSHYPDSTLIFGGTREEFLRSIKMLGARIESKDQVLLARDPWHVFLRCPATDWIRVFGPVKTLPAQYGPGGCLSFETWEYQCTDGSILCVGCQYQRFGKVDWVIVRAIYVD
jgi:hypothetical protein